MRHQDLTRIVMTRAGAASLRSWTEGVRADDPEALLADVRARYWRSLARLDWPSRTALRLHLVFSAVPGASLYASLRARGWAARPATAAVAAVIERGSARPRRRLERLMRHRTLRAAFLPAICWGTRLGFPAPGWEAHWRERTADVAALDMTRCLLLDTLTRLDAAEITPAYCAWDDLLYSDLCPQLRWLRNGTLATGAPVCDFRFERVEDGVR